MPNSISIRKRFVVIIETHGLSKQYRRVFAVRDLDLAVPEGGISAFLGPNGSGKTTTNRLARSVPGKSGRGPFMIRSKTLWHKSWLESRSRFLGAAVVMTLVIAWDILDSKHGMSRFDTRFLAGTSS
jgi:ABC-type uncharacterized transport system ATPase subunit